jgi:methyl-accepting chemotaxis protein
MRKAGIARRMTLVLAASIAVSLGASLSLSYLLRVSSASARRLAATSRSKSQLSTELLDVVVRLQSGTQKMVQSRDPDAIEALMQQNDVLVKQASSKVQETAEDNGRIVSAFGALVQANEEVKDLLLHAHNAESQQAIVEKSNPAFAALLAAMTKYQDEVAQSLDQEAARTASRSAHLETTVYVLVTCSVVLLILYALALVRTVSQSLRRVIVMVRDVAEGEGDLTKRLEIASQDELGELASWFNRFMDKLHALVSQVAGSAEHMASASEEIAATTASMAMGAETQKDQVHQIATAMQEMSATVHEVSENSTQAAEFARQAAETACEGGSMVEDNVTRMRAIAESVRETGQKVHELGNRSDQIGRIVTVIDDIADQTNLLALNAAIEAARAGEQGRGFAVVADEVRKLAERTTKATREIAEMIEKVQGETRSAVRQMESGTQQVEQGVEATGRAGDSLRRIIEQAERVGNVISQIATAATEQSSTTDQVNSSMDQINRLVAESADGARQSAQACEQLSGLACELSNIVSRFQLEGQPQPAPGPKARVSGPVATSTARAQGALGQGTLTTSR